MPLLGAKTSARCWMMSSAACQSYGVSLRGSMCPLTETSFPFDRRSRHHSVLCFEISRRLRVTQQKSNV
uniref:Secreted protein n=1 Tax=Steinernema glaseri TaxID=37863 RepID=A0A1I7Z668_9BILA